MNKLNSLLQEFIADESGLTAVEYAIAGGLVVGGMVIAFVNLGDAATTEIDALCEAVNGDPDGTACDPTAAAGGTTP